jgi:predicted RNase H-like HicB family nuclease
MWDDLGARMYPVGLPGWKIASRFGVPLSLRVDVHFDRAVNIYWATSPDLNGLAVEGETLDVLRSEIRGAAESLLELAMIGKSSRAIPVIRFLDDALTLA